MSNKSKKRLAVFLVLTVLVTGFIFYNSLQNSEESSAASDIIKNLVEPIFDAIFGDGAVDANYVVRKGAHFTEFFILGVMTFNVMASSVRRREQLKSIFGYGLFYVIAVAVTDEFIQSFSDRTSSVKDVLIDFSGAASGLLVSVLIMCLIENGRKVKKYGDQN